MATTIPPPFSYGKVRDYQNALDKGTHVFNNLEAEFRTSVLPGARIMREHQRLARGDELTAPQRFELLFMVFVEQSRDLGWTWWPGVPASGGALVDGLKQGCECAAYAHGLYLLAIAPPPFGLGLPSGDGIGATVQWVSYSGDQVEGQWAGFVSTHQPEGVLNLLPNLHTPLGLGLELPGALRGETLYLWANHKVVRFNSTVFDPTYGRQYAQVEDMAVMRVTGWEVLGGEKPASLDIFNNLANGDGDGRHVLSCKDSNDNLFWVRITPTTLRGSERLWQGPYTAAQLQWLRGQLAKGSDKPISADQILAAA